MSINSTTQQALDQTEELMRQAKADLDRIAQETGNQPTVEPGSLSSDLVHQVLEVDRRVAAGGPGAIEELHRKNESLEHQAQWLSGNTQGELHHAHVMSDLQRHEEEKQNLEGELQKQRDETDAWIAAHRADQALLPRHTPRIGRSGKQPRRSTKANRHTRHS
jgi:hypothetical protein